MSDSDGETEHPVADVGRCLEAEWIGNCDTFECHEPSVVESLIDGMPITIEWDGEGYIWRGKES